MTARRTYFSGEPIVLTLETPVASFPANTCDVSKDSPKANVLKGSLEPWRKEKSVITLFQYAKTVTSTFSNPFTNAVIASRLRCWPDISKFPLS